MTTNYLFLDLDGTLVDTTYKFFKPMKDGQEVTDLQQIKFFDGVIEFLNIVKKQGFEPIIISDSHPKYVQPIWAAYFKPYCSLVLSLADKPNTRKTQDFLVSNKIDILQGNHFFIGDSWLDIELGRGLRIPTILTSFYKNKGEIRDGIGDYNKNIKSGPTYYVENFIQILDILTNPLANLLSLEAHLLGHQGYPIKKNQFRKAKSDQKDHGGKCTFYRSLAREVQGECDQYDVTKEYYKFLQKDRDKQIISTIAGVVANYIRFVINTKIINWDILTYVTDKHITKPTNKIGELFDLTTNNILQKSINCLTIFEWDSNVKSFIRDQPTFPERKKFVHEYFSLKDSINIKNKNIIILDDQFTTGATAEAITEILRKKGAKHILFIYLFQLTNSVKSRKLCPTCLKEGIEKPLLVKINKQKGTKFYSCVPKEYKGNGCGYIENIADSLGTII